MNILIITNPCHGGGDIIFSMKLYNYLKEWYDCNVKIATTSPKSFISFGFDENNLFFLFEDGKHGREQCRRIGKMKLHEMNGEKVLPYFDLIFVAPLQADFDIKFGEIKKLLPYATREQTFYFSEYNDDMNKGHDFPIGIGKNRLGMFLTTTNENLTEKQKIPYTFVYISDNIDFAERCFISFLKMILEKYDYPSFKFIIQEWIVKDILKNKEKFIKICKKYYNKIVVMKKNKLPNVIYDDENGDDTLYFDGTILPLPYSKMPKLYHNCVGDLLVTGDQSITDALSYCKNTNIWYQIAPWKKDFAKELKKELPNSYFKSIITSCGTIRGLKYKLDSKKIIKRWDFRVLGRKKLDEIINKL